MEKNVNKMLKLTVVDIFLILLFLILSLSVALKEKF